MASEVVATKINKVTITPPATGSTLTIADGKTLNVTQDTALDEAVAMSSKVTKGGSGQVTNTTLPAFLATASTQLDITGDATSYTVLFANEVFDQGSNFASSIFTAPVTGKYRLSVGFILAGLAAANTYILSDLVTSNRAYVIEYIDDCLYVGNKVLQASPLVDMDAGDTAYVYLDVRGSTRIIDIWANNGYFSGHLVC